MTTRLCVRSSEAETVRDGRLRGADLRSFVRHAASCADCRREILALGALTDELKRAALPHVDDLTKRRGRQQLLRDASNTDSEHVRRPRRGIAIAAALAAAASVAFFGVLRTREPRAVPAMPVEFAPVEFASVDAAPGTRFERVRDGITERITIADGELSIVVRHPTGREHVVVRLPDGELEDLGTSFVVRVERDETTRVAVREGRVVLRLGSQAPVDIAAGTMWERAKPSAPASVAPAVSARRPPSALARAQKPPSSVASAAPVDATKVEFEAAMAAYRNGEHRFAAAKLAAFVDAHPSDSRLEDASYLRIIALQRAGDEPSAREAAKDYLARHPNGFRHREVERMLVSE